MKSLVLDSSAICVLILKEKGWKNVKKNLEKYDILYSIEFSILECLNVIWKRKKIIRDIENDKEVIRRLFLLRKILTFYPQKKLYKLAYRISGKYEISIYDSMFIALAKITKSDFMTFDEEQKRIAKREKIRTI